MRKKLGKLHGKRTRFRGEVVKFGTKNECLEETVLLKNVTLVENDDVLTDHLWFTCGKWSDPISEGDVIEFDARVKLYKKGYWGHREDLWDAPPPSTDYHLAYPTKVKILEKQILN